MVAVRAMAPVAGKPPNIGETDVGDSLADQFDVGIVAVVAHAVGDHGRHQRLDRSQHGHGEGRSEQAVDQAGVPLRDREMRQAAGNSAEARADGFHRQLEQERGHGRAQHGDDRAGNAIGDDAAEQHRGHSPGRQQRGRQRKCVGRRTKRLHAQPEFAGNLVQMQAEEIFDLGAGNQHGDAVGKADDHRPRNKLHRGAHAGCAQNDEHDARHHGAHEQSVDAVDGDDPGDHDDERAGGSADLSLRSAQCGDQKAGDDGAVDARLRRQSGGDGESHGQRQGHQSNGDSGDDIFQKFAEAVCRAGR